MSGDVGDISLYPGATNLSRSASVEQEHVMTKARLEAAKDMYKREKDKYRKEREELRKERDRRGLSTQE